MKVKVLGIFSVLIIMAMVGCNINDPNNYQEPSKVAADYNIDSKALTGVPYIGGSLIYSESNPSISHLSPGMKIPVRLGTVEEAIDEETGEAILVDVEEQTKYGYIKVADISTDSINLDYTYYDNKFESKNEGSVTILKDGFVDIDNDGDNDLAYNQAYKRAGMENACYLMFLSSQEDKSTTTYSLLEKQFSSNEYPGGIMGLNPEGSLLLRKKSSTTSSKSTGSNSAQVTFNGTTPFVGSGDYMMDADGSVSEIISVQTKSNTSNITTEPTDEKTIVNAIPLIYFNYEGSVSTLTNTASAPVSKTTDWSTYEAALKKMQQAFDKYKRVTLINKSAWTHEIKVGDYGKISMQIGNIKAEAGLFAKYSGSWHKIDAKVELGLLVESKNFIKAEVFRSFSQDIWSKEIAKIGTTITIGPVVIDVEGPLTMGVYAGGSGKFTASFNMNASLYAGAGLSANASLKTKKVLGVTVPYGINSPKFEGTSTFEKNFYIDSKPQVTGTGSVYVRPYFGMGLQIRLWKVVYANGMVKPYIGPQIDATLNNNTVTVKAKINYGAIVDATIGFKLWKFEKKKTWKLKDFSSTLWEKTLYTKTF